MQLAEEIYRLTAQFPKYETYGLSSQIQRSAVSVPSNIAEGHGRNSSKAFDHFLWVLHRVRCQSWKPNSYWPNNWVI
ncbi:MAG: four helix bundle protein [Gallionella sp.]